MVSTDSVRYAEIAKAYGAKVPFLRTSANSTSYASSWDVVKEVIERYKQQGKIFDTATLLQPTSPLRTSEHIKEAFSFFLEKKARAV